MPKLTFIQHNGTAHVVEAEVGLSMMEAAVGNGVPGIDADCGGECSCATCHVIVADDWMARVGGPSELESSMLSLTPERCPNSRLSCQIPVTSALDGVVVRLPEFQM